MNEQTQEQINQLVMSLGALNLSPTSNLTYKKVDGDVYSTFTINCKDSKGVAVELVKHTNIVADPNKVKTDMAEAEVAIRASLEEIKAKRAVIEAED